MSKVTIGIDIAKSVFHLVFMNSSGRVLKKKKLKRQQLMEYFSQLPLCVVVMEACGSCHYWSRELSKLGHEVKSIAPKYVVPYRKGNKHDYNDAEAIAEASQREGMRFVPLKSQEQQDVQLMHRIRERMISQQTALSNQIRGLLAEYGIVYAKGISTLVKALPFTLEDADNGLSVLARIQFQGLLDDLLILRERIKDMDTVLKVFAQNHPICKRLMSMSGIGPVIATALYAGVGQGQAFNSGRHLAAWMGLVPKQHTTGDNPKLLGISKRGNTYLRTQIINGARAALRHIGDKTDKVSQWCRSSLERMCFNKACVALANKMVRMAWAMLHYQQDYLPGKINKVAA